MEALKKRVSWDQRMRHIFVSVIARFFFPGLMLVFNYLQLGSLYLCTWLQDFKGRQTSLQLQSAPDTLPGGQRAHKAPGHVNVKIMA